MVSPQGGYRIAGVAGLLAALLVLPIRRLGRPGEGGDPGRGSGAESATTTDGASEDVEPTVPGGIAMRFTSAEALEAERGPEVERRTA